MIALTEHEIQGIENVLHKGVEEIDFQICEAEQSIFSSIGKLKAEKTLSGKNADLQNLETQFNNYCESVRSLRAKLAALEKQTHDLVEPGRKPSAYKVDKENIAYEIQRETHDKPATFSDFVKGLLMSRDAPDDRMK